MLDSIRGCEVGKDNQILSYSDVIIFGNNEILLNETLEVLAKFENHFQSLAIGKYLFSNKTDSAEIIINCIKKGSLPIVIDADIDIYNKLHAYVSEQYLLSNSLDLFEKVKSIACHCIGFQRHLVSPATLAKLESQSMHSYSLGMLRNNVVMLEPGLRQSKAMHVDYSVCKSAYFSKNCFGLPTGMDLEDVIQIIKYASHSPFLKLLTFESIENYTYQEHCALAESIWYFLEGISLGHHHVEQANERVFVTIHELDDALEFAFNTHNNLYWVKIQQSEYEFIPCTYEEFELAKSGSLTDRLFKALLH